MFGAYAYPESGSMIPKVIWSKITLHYEDVIALRDWLNQVTSSTVDVDGQRPATVTAAEVSH